jgi:Ca-activated chloride channel homolog
MRIDFHSLRLLSFASCLLVLLVLSAGNQHIAAQSPTIPPEPKELDTIRVDSDLVDLKVSVISLGAQTASVSLEQKDFQVFEDGLQQQISFFAAADTPFDLVLLLDLSGSTSQKIKLIRRSAKRFVEATRPIDRVAVVTFTNVPVVASDLTADREQLKDAIEHIKKPAGGTNFWDSLRFVVESMCRPTHELRRTAIVVMTDGVDNALPQVYGDGSATSFSDLLNIVRSNETLVYPIYIDTEAEEARLHRTPRDAFAIARNQLQQLSQACGTLVYPVSELKDLDKVYERVIRDLSTVYSIGYKPSNPSKDGGWRNVTVKLLERPDLSARAKNGYFAKSDAQSVKGANP